MEVVVVVQVFVVRKSESHVEFGRRCHGIMDVWRSGRIGCGRKSCIIRDYPDWDSK